MAESYQIEIATNPAFGSSQVFLSEQISSSPFVLPIQLQEEEGEVVRRVDVEPHPATSDPMARCLPRGSNPEPMD